MANETEPLFSVVISTFNRCEYVIETIRSVMEQTLQPYEVILVSDGCTDDTVAIVRSRFPSVKVIEQPNLGRGIATNTGVVRATGNWICLLDDDDLWHKDKLQIVSNYIAAHPGVEAINSPVWLFADAPDGPDKAFGLTRDFVATSIEECHAQVMSGDPSNNSYEYLKIRGDSHRLLLERNRGTLSGSVILRDTLLRAGCFCPMQTVGDDWTLFLNVARLCEWHTIDQRLVFCRLHSGQTSAEPQNGLRIIVGILNAWYTGRPFPGRLSSDAFESELAKYRVVYRNAVQAYCWGAFKQRQFSFSVKIFKAGSLLLPIWTDRLYVAIPPQITWRVEKYFFGMHK